MQLNTEDKWRNILQSPPAELSASYYPSLDGLRTVSIGLVLFAHLSDTYPFPKFIKSIITQTGLLGVQIFFVISGFLITSLLLKEQHRTGTISLTHFYLRRAFRILPLVFLYLTVLAAMNVIFRLQVPLRCFAGAALFLANISYFKGSWYTAHFWSLSVEEQYYILFPFLLKKFTKNIHFIILFLLLLITFIKEAAYLQIPLLPASKLADTIAFLLFQSEGVLIGSLLAILWFRKRLPIGFIKKYSRILLVFLPVAILSVYTNLIRMQSFNSILASLCIALFVMCVLLQTRGFLFVFLNHKIIVLIGRMSFSIYIWQQMFTSPDGMFGSFSRLPNNITVITVVTCLSYYFIETRFLKLKRRFEIQAFR